MKRKTTKTANERITLKGGTFFVWCWLYCGRLVVVVWSCIVVVAVVVYGGRLVVVVLVYGGRLVVVHKKTPPIKGDVKK